MKNITKVELVSDVLGTYLNDFTTAEICFRSLYKSDYFLIGPRKVSGTSSAFQAMGYGDDSELIRIINQESWKLAVGSASDNDIVIDDPIISKYHAELGKYQGIVYIQDLGSSNGTYVNGEQILFNSPTPLNPNANQMSKNQTNKKIS